MLRALLLVTLAACGGGSTPEAAPSGDAARAPVKPAEAAGDATQAEAPERITLSGEVVETMDAGGYTYVKVRAEGGERWAAIPQSRVAVGRRVTIVDGAVMRGFSSPTLGRTFDEIVFGRLEEGGTAAAGAASMPADHPPVDAANDPAVAAAHRALAGTTEKQVTEAIPKAEGPDGRTVAEVYAQRAELAGKTVGVRAKVVKFNAGILGRNWVHVQDGTGSADDGSFDLVVTTSDTARVGDVVLARGTVAVDRDFGAGYRYAVIVEDATIEKQP